MKYFWITVAGGLGVLSRYCLSGFIQKYTSLVFPWGTFVVNMVGCFLFGIIWGLSIERSAIPESYRVYLLPGFLGGFTTFSTFIGESCMLLEDQEYLYTALNLGGQVISGIVLFMIGRILTQLI